MLEHLKIMSHYFGKGYKIVLRQVSNNLITMDRTKQKIMDAAVKVIAKDGYEGSTTRGIAQEAGVSEVTLFRKFKSKENILREVIIMRSNEVLQTFDSLVISEKGADLETGIRDIGRVVMNIIEENLDLVFIGIEEGRRRPEIADIIMNVFQQGIGLLSQFFEMQIKSGRMKNTNTKALALALLSHHYFVNILKGLNGEEALDINSETEVFIDIFTRGIAQE